MMNIILAGYIALEATHKLIQNEKPALSCRFSNRFLSLSDEMTKELSHNRERIVEVLAKEKITIPEEDMVELSDMGIYGTLWNFSEKIDCGLNIFLDKISVRQETIEICEQLNVNPYTYPSKGAWLIRSDSAYEIKDILESNGIMASVIGKETDSKDRVIINNGERRFLTPIDRLLKDEQGFENLR